MRSGVTEGIYIRKKEGKGSEERRGGSAPIRSRNPKALTFPPHDIYHTQKTRKRNVVSVERLRKGKGYFTFYIICDLHLFGVSLCYGYGGSKKKKLRLLADDRRGTLKSVCICVRLGRGLY